ncbi:MAG: methyltransferase domain-containing protein [Bryobacteraceae bacterium]|nr:methyltransferase domain-containing protein [Bryobacteraceae bacterium]
MAEFTGERVIPGQVDADLWNEHYARYLFASRLARGRRVVDLGSGSGYGTAALAESAAHVTGVEISDEAVRYAAERYASPKVEFVNASATETGLEKGSYDLVVAFEVIEHLSNWADLLREAKRLLKPSGQLIISTPNRDYYAESRRLAGPNPYHEHEFDFAEFDQALRELFPHVSLFTQNHAGAVVFQPLGKTAGTELRMDRGTAQAEDAHFYVAVCALSPQIGAPTFVYLPTAANVLREREQHIQKLEGELVQKTEWLEKNIADHAELVKTHEGLKQELEQRNRWAQELNQQLAAAGDRVVALQEELSAEQAAARETVARYEAKVGELEADLAAKVAWAQETEQRLTAEMEGKIQELAKCVALLQQAEQTLEERTNWALTLDKQREELEAQLSAVQASRWHKLGRSIGLGPKGLGSR